MESQEKITNAVYDILREQLKINRAEITMDSKIEDLCKDSIQVFSLIMAFEKKFNRRLQYDELIRIETVGDIVKYATEVLHT